MKKIILGCLALSTLCSCATTPSTSAQDGSGKSLGASIVEKVSASMAAMNNSLAGGVQNAGEKRPSDGTTTGRQKLRDTDLKDILSRSTTGKWPRVAVTINKLPTWFYEMPPAGQPGRYSYKDCINISVTAWQDMKHSKNYNNMDFCGNDIVTETPFSDVGLIWKNFGLVSSSPNTGTQRTRGPLPPSRLFPNSPGLDMFFQLNGSYYVGSIMATLGYNWKEPQDYRFWIVNVPTQAEVAHR